MIEALGPQATGEALAQLETDDAVEILADLDEAEQKAILDRCRCPSATAIEQGLAFPEWSAGRLMQREVVAVPEYWTVGQTVDYLRAHPDLPDDFYDIFLVDPRFKVVGDVPLGRLLRSRRAVPLTDIKYKELRTFPAEADQEEVARAFHRYALVSAPVVDADGRLLGVITVDDVVDVIDEEAEDDILKLGGVSADDTFVPALQTSMKRLPWLVVNLFTALMGAFVIAQFEGTIARLVALATLMPMVAGMGGNAGTQALTVTVRSLAAGEITRGNAWRAMRKELAVGLLNGGTFLVAGGCWCCCGTASRSSPPCSALPCCSTSSSPPFSAPPSPSFCIASVRTLRWPPASSSPRSPTRWVLRLPGACDLCSCSRSAKQTTFAGSSRSPGYAAVDSRRCEPTCASGLRPIQSGKARTAARLPCASRPSLGQCPVERQIPAPDQDQVVQAHPQEQGDVIARMARGRARSAQPRSRNHQRRLCSGCSGNSSVDDAPPGTEWPAHGAALELPTATAPRSTSYSASSRRDQRWPQVPSARTTGTKSRPASVR